jgi:hypothetical protein
MANKLGWLQKIEVMTLVVTIALMTWAAWAGALEPPTVDAEALWRHINHEDNFRQWGSWQEFEGREKSYMPYGFFRRVYVNAKAMKAKGNPLPPGSIMVWEGYGMDDNTYAPTDEVVAYGVMYKVPGFNPNAGDWFWARYSGAGKVLEAGALNKCIDCHDTARDNDWVEDHKLAVVHPNRSDFTPPAGVQEDRIEPPLDLPPRGSERLR